MVPCILFEDEHLLVINKPAGVNTHAADPYSNEGIYDWLRCREPRWASLAIIQRLDKDTSGVMVFAKTPEANRSLTKQFEEHSIIKKYVLETASPVRKQNLEVRCALARFGDKYGVPTKKEDGKEAVTRFEKISVDNGITRLIATPLTGRTHQIRVHALLSGFPILGDGLYGGAISPRLHLHAFELTLKHPVNHEVMSFKAPVVFTDAPWLLRAAFIDETETNVYRLIHGAHDGHPGWHVDRLGDWLLSQSNAPITDRQQQVLKQWMQEHSFSGAYHKVLDKQVRKTPTDTVLSPVFSENAGPDNWSVRENGVLFSLRRTEGYSVGLFLDQRDNRRKLLANYIKKDFPVVEAGWTGAKVLNTFAYTCGFSTCAALKGAHTVSVDLSSKYLEWGRENYRLNNLDPEAHLFLHGDVFDWIKRLAKKQQQYDLVLLDPPSFSTSKQSGVFRVESHYSKLVEAVLPLIKPSGVLFVSTNLSTLHPEKFLEMIRSAITRHRSIRQEYFCPQPPDFPTDKEEPAYLKTAWFKL